MRFTSILAAIAIACGCLLFADSASAQGRGNFFGGGQGGGMMLLLDEGVRKELEIVDSQWEKLQAVQESTREKMGELFRSMREAGGGGGGPPDFNAMREKMEPITKEAQKQMDEILLPEQRSRLKQLTVQSMFKQGGGGPWGGGGGLNTGAFESEEVKTALGLTDQQIEDLKKARTDIEKEMNEKLNKVREEARQKLLLVLTPEQRAKFKELTGDDFTFSPPDFSRFGRGGPGGGPGGPGGRGGRGGRPGGNGQPGANPQ